jgi:hypothetical protein
VVQLSNGSVHLNTDSVFFQSTPFIYSLLLHEIAHAIGLDHVSDRNQVMVPSTGRAYPGYGPGDLEGLWNVGAARGCLRPSRF